MGNNTIRNYKSVSIYIKKRFNIKRNRLTLRQLEDIKDILKKDHSLRELRTLRAGIKGELEQLKSMSVIIAIFALTLTIFFNLHASIQGAGEKITEITTNFIESVNEMRVTVGSIEEKMESVEQSYKSLTDAFQIINVSVFRDVLFMGLIFIILSFLLFYFYSSIKFLASISALINETYDEKKEMHGKENMSGF